MWRWWRTGPVGWGWRLYRLWQHRTYERRRSDTTGLDRTAFVEDPARLVYDNLDTVGRKHLKS